MTALYARRTEAAKENENRSLQILVVIFWESSATLRVHSEIWNHRGVDHMTLEHHRDGRTTRP